MEISYPNSSAISFQLHNLTSFFLFKQLETFKRQLVQSLSDDDSSVRLHNIHFLAFLLRVSREVN